MVLCSKNLVKVYILLFLLFAAMHIGFAFLSPIYVPLSAASARPAISSPSGLAAL